MLVVGEFEAFFVVCESAFELGGGATDVLRFFMFHSCFVDDVIFTAFI